MKITYAPRVLHASWESPAFHLLVACHFPDWWPYFICKFSMAANVHIYEWGRSKMHKQAICQKSFSKIQIMLRPQLEESIQLHIKVINQI